MRVHAAIDGGSHGDGVVPFAANQWRSFGHRRWLLSMAVRIGFRYPASVTMEPNDVAYRSPVARLELSTAGWNQYALRRRGSRVRLAGSQRRAEQTPAALYLLCVQ